jgi:plasmid stabilization system protein ParE
MAAQVVLMDRAFADLQDSFDWWSENRSAEQAARWYNNALKSLQSLATRASRCRLAPENDAFPFEVRQLNFGLGRRPTHRAMFTIRPDMVVVLRVQHLAQIPLTLEDV